MCNFMKNQILTTLTIATIIVACSNQDNQNSSGSVKSGIDSCEIALKYENAKTVESQVDNNYSGELNNYWGNDKTKLDIKHIFKNGKLVKSYFYYESQKIQEEYTFKCGALHGVQKWYYENGTLYKTIPYSYGYRNGTIKIYDEEGRLRGKVNFHNDTAVGKAESFDELGNLINNDTIKK